MKVGRWVCDGVPMTARSSYFVHFITRKLKIKPMLFDMPDLYIREIFFIYMRTSRRCGVYPGHEPDQPDMEVSVARLIQQTTN